jgi:hypothetical protein
MENLKHLTVQAMLGWGRAPKALSVMIPIPANGMQGPAFIVERILVELRIHLLLLLACNVYFLAADNGGMP